MAEFRTSDRYQRERNEARAELRTRPTAQELDAVIQERDSYRAQLEEMRVETAQALVAVMLERDRYERERNELRTRPSCNICVRRGWYPFILAYSR